MARIVLADDHPLVRDGLRRLIEAEPDLRVVGEAAASTPAAGWTRLLAAAVAHEINNLAHGFSGAPVLLGVGTADAGASASLVEGGLAQMRKLGERLRALARAGETDAWERLDDACADASAEVDPVRGQVLRAEPIPGGLRVRGTAAALRTAIGSLLEHAAAASPTAGTIRLAVRETEVLAPDEGISAGRASASRPVMVEIAASEATGLGEIGMARLDALLGTSLRELRGDLSLVLAGAIADALGGAVYLASSSESGLVLTLHLVALV